jgi:hypothetical protein
MRLGRVCGLGVLWLFSGRQAFGQSAQEIGVPAADKLELHNVKAEGQLSRASGCASDGCGRG